MKTSMVVVMLSLLLMACDGNKAYYHFEHIDNEGWCQNDTITFAIPPQTAGTYHATLCMRATHAFPYSTITVRTETSFSPSGKCSSQRLRCHIYNDMGKMNGKRGITSTELRFPLHDITLQDSDSVTIKIHHLMSREALPGITDLGMEITGE